MLLLGNYCHSFWSACSRFSLRKYFLKYDLIILSFVSSLATWRDADFHFLPFLIWYNLTFFSPLCIFLNIIKYLFSSAVLISLHHHCCSSVYLFFPQQEVEKLSHSIQKFVLQDMENLTNGYFLLFFLQVLLDIFNCSVHHIYVCEHFNYFMYLNSFSWLLSRVQVE